MGTASTEPRRRPLSAFSQRRAQLAVTYLYDELPAANFGIEWEGPQRPRQAIPLEALRVADDLVYPRLSVTANTPGDGTGASRRWSKTGATR